MTAPARERVFFSRIIPIVIALLTILAFLPSLGNDFVQWDDDKNFLTNPHYRGLGIPQLRWMWTTFHMGHYIPVTWMTLGLDFVLWGMKPFGYHLSSILFHSFNAVLFYLLAVRLLRIGMNLPEADDVGLALSAGLAALCFSVHPLRVESVAWVTERRDVVSGLLCLLTVIAYLKYCAAEARTARKWYAGSLLAFTLALLSRATCVPLVAVLLILDIYPLKRFGSPKYKKPGSPNNWSVLLEKAPYIAVGLAAGLLMIKAAESIHTLRSLEQQPLATRIGQALYALVFHIQKFLIPLDLSPVYTFDSRPGLTQFLGIALLIATIVLVVKRRSYPAVLAALCCYVVIISPTLGIIQTHSLTYDRYSYLANMGWAILAGGGFALSWRGWKLARVPTFGLVLAGWVAFLYLGWFGKASWYQSKVWRNSESLWTHALSVENRNHIALSGLGVILSAKNQIDEAIALYRKSLEVNPNYSTTHHNLANALRKKGELELAFWHYRQAIRIKPHFADAHINLGTLYFEKGELNDAISHFRKALGVQPTNAVAFNNLGVCYSKQGKINLAIQHFEKALQFKPNYENARENLSAMQNLRGLN